MLAAKAPSSHGSIETIMFQLLGLHEEDTGNCLDDRIAGGVVPGRSTRVCRHAATVIDSSARACRRAAVETSGRTRACRHWVTLRMAAHECASGRGDPLGTAAAHKRGRPPMRIGCSARVARCHEQMGRLRLAKVGAQGVRDDQAQDLSYGD